MSDRNLETTTSVHTTVAGVTVQQPDGSVGSNVNANAHGANAPAGSVSNYANSNKAVAVTVQSCVFRNPS